MHAHVIMNPQAKTEAVRAEAGGLSSPSSISRGSLLEDPPMGEGWDENGNDLSKVANDVSVLFCFCTVISCCVMSYGMRAPP